MTQFTFSFGDNCKEFHGYIAGDGTLTIKYTVEAPIATVAEKDKGTVVTSYDKHIALREYRTKGKMAAVKYLREHTILTLRASMSIVEEWIQEEEELNKARLYAEMQDDYYLNNNRFDVPEDYN